MKGSAIDGRVVFCAAGTPACASTRRTVEWCSMSCRPIAPGVLPSGVSPGSTAGTLIPGAGTPVRSAAGLGRAVAGAINIAAIAPTADAHQHAAAPAAIQPVALLPLLHRTPPQDWTAPCFAGINTVRKVAPTGISPLEAREFVRGFPGLRCFGVACSLSGNASLRPEPRNPGKENGMPELLPPMAADRASVTS